MHKHILRLAAFLGALAVALGAFAAHGLKEVVPENAAQVFETGVRYQFYHVFALFFAGQLYGKYGTKLLWYATVSFVLGILLFSGSLYLMTFKIAKDIKGLDWLGPVTPIGGVSFIAGWLCLGLGIPNSRHYVKRHDPEDRK